MKIFIYLLIFSFFQTPKVNSLFIKGLEEKYKKNQNINFTVVNIKKQKMFYYISLEGFDEKWHEMFNDIYNPKEKSTRIRTIGPNQKIKNNIALHKIFYSKNPINLKKYRFKISYGDDYKTSKTSYSKSFIMF